jgi:predicted NodU family carbamoyl transferase
MAELYLGTASARLGPAAALIDNEQGQVAACEENRLTRAVDSGTVGPPELATAELLRWMGRERQDIKAHSDLTRDAGNPHLAHATYALCASGFDQAVVVVCGTEVSAWRTDDGSAQNVPSLERINLDDPPPFAAEFGTLTARLGFRPTRDEHLVEALARGGHPDARELQHRLAERLLATLTRVRDLTRISRVC